MIYCTKLYCRPEEEEEEKNVKNRTKKNV